MWKTALKIGLIITASEGILYIFYQATIWFRRKPVSPFHKVLFFPDKKIPCREYLLTPQGCNKKKCTYSHDESSSFIQLIRCVLEAEKSLDICMFSITCHELAQAVLIKHQQGAIVRIISDTEYMHLKGSKMPEFLEQGIPIRHDRSSYLMHHKFLVVDNKFVVTGSFNWTHAAVIGNNENVLVSNHPDILEPYCQEFEKLWFKFCPPSEVNAPENKLF